MDDKPIKVLVIEDNPGDTRLIEEMLTQAREVLFNFECVDRLHTGLQRLAQGRIDVVLLDLGLPDSQGLETLAKAHAQTPQVPIVVLTGLYDQALGVRAVREGAQDYLVKGQVDSDWLEHSILYAIERKKGERAKTELIQRLEAKNKELQYLLQKLQTTQAQLVQSAKMASLGQLVAGIAHELNNPISFVHSNVKRLEEYSNHITTFYNSCQALFDEIAQGSYPQLKSHLKALRYLEKEREIDFLIQDLSDLAKETKEGTERVSKVVENLRTFSRTQEERQKVDVNEALEATVLLLRNQIKDRIEIVRNYAQRAEIQGYPNQIKEVFLNLLTNAGQAIKEKGKITLETAVEADTVLVRISDTGEGVPEDKLETIFDPFYTTKPAEQGTGLGLSIVRGIIENHEGKISVQSQVGKGTTFTVSLPLGTEEKE